MYTPKIDHLFSTFPPLKGLWLQLVQSDGVGAPFPNASGSRFTISPLLDWTLRSNYVSQMNYDNIAST
ncbi:MAG: hypothetical protein IPO69_23155 [Saprospiraceae bacterium]|nr:hypothetical protein [Saprospiraceae bacterium]